MVASSAHHNCAFTRFCKVLHHATFWGKLQMLVMLACHFSLSGAACHFLSQASVGVLLFVTGGKILFISLGGHRFSCLRKSPLRPWVSHPYSTGYASVCWLRCVRLVAFHLGCVDVRPLFYRQVITSTDGYLTSFYFCLPLAWVLLVYTWINVWLTWVYLRKSWNKAGTSQTALHMTNKLGDQRYR